MNLFAVVGSVAQGWVFAARGFRRAPVHEVFFVIGGIQLALLLGLGFFHAPALVRIFEPLVRFLGGEGATHYPDHFWALPELFRTSSAVLAVAFWYAAWIVASMRYAGRAGRWAEGLRRAPTAMVVGLLYFGSAWGLTSLFNLIPEEVSLRSFVIRIGLQGIELGLIVLIQATLAYALPVLALERVHAGRAIAKSARWFRADPLTPFLLVAIPAAALFPVNFFMFEMNMDEAGLPPEGVGMLLTARLVLRVLFDALIVGGMTFLYLRRDGGRA